MSVNTTQKSKSQPDWTEDIDISASELFELFGDEYTRRVYETITEQPRSGRAVAEAADVSRATAYRRLNDLRDAGLVRTEMMICDDGYHKERFKPVPTSISISLGDGMGAMVDNAD
jgi:DNA-binding transcriptional ArsR family regulator